MGLPAAMAARLAASSAKAQPVEIMPENWSTLRVFLGMETQWRRAGMSGIPTGLDYAALPIVAGAMAVDLDADLMERLKVMEGAALKAMLEMRGNG